MAVFSWVTEYNRAKEALANRQWNSYFISSIENSEQMRTTFTRLGNVTDFIDWLAAKAAEEQAGLPEGGIIMMIGGN